MSVQEPSTVAGTIDECLDEVNDFVATLERYPPTAVAVAMSVHLQSMLRALLEYGLCSRQQAREFIQELEREVLEVELDEHALSAAHAELESR